MQRLVLASRCFCNCESSYSSCIQIRKNEKGRKKKGKRDRRGKICLDKEGVIEYN